MPESEIIPLAFLYTQGSQSIDGATRFQKLVFLAQQENNIPEKYTHHADKFGPFSPQFNSDLQELTEQGLIERHKVTNEVGNTKYIYSITPSGIQKAKSLLGQYDRISILFDRIEAIKNQFNSEPLPELLRYVYRKYPTYTTETELNTDQLFDPDTRSQFLEPSSGNEFAGTAPGEWREINSSAEDIFTI
jgi:uncharacterized protein YwgA